MSFVSVVNEIPVAAFIFLIIYILLSIFECFFAFKEMEKERRIVKPLLMVFLSLFAIFTIPNHPLVYIGLLGALIGDIFILFKNKKLFAIGVLGFFIGHILNILEVFIFLAKGNVPIPLIVMFPVFFIVMFAVSYKYFIRRKSPNAKAAFGATLYYSTLLLALPVMCFATAKLGSYMFLTIIGYTLFVVSDTFLVYSMTREKEIKRRHFYIMLSYLAAQLLIVLGFALTCVANGIA